MLLFFSGVLVFCGISFAQNANLLSGLAGGSSTIAYYGPYYKNGTEYWVARVEPENGTYVISGSKLIRDPEKIGEILATHQTYVFAVRRPWAEKYLSLPEIFALGSADLFLGFFERTVAPFAFGTEKMLVSSVPGFFLPPGVSKAAAGVVSAGELSVGAEIGVLRGEILVYKAGLEAGLALENVRSGRSYEGAVDYSKKARVVADSARMVAEKNGLAREKTGLFFDSATGLAGALNESGAPHLGTADEVKKTLDGRRSADKAAAYAAGFCESPPC